MPWGSRAMAARVLGTSDAALLRGADGPAGSSSAAEWASGERARAMASAVGSGSSKKRSAWWRRGSPRFDISGSGPAWRWWGAPCRRPWSRSRGSACRCCSCRTPRCACTCRSGSPRSSLLGGRGGDLALGELAEDALVGVERGRVRQVRAAGELVAALAALPDAGVGALDAGRRAGGAGVPGLLAGLDLADAAADADAVAGAEATDGLDLLGAERHGRFLQRGQDPLGVLEQALARRLPYLTIWGVWRHLTAPPARAQGTARAARWRGSR